MGKLADPDQFDAIRGKQFGNLANLLPISAAEDNLRELSHFYQAIQGVGDGNSCRKRDFVKVTILVSDLIASRVHETIVSLRVSRAVLPRCSIRLIV